MKRIILVTILTIGWCAPVLAFSIPDDKQCYLATLLGSDITPDRAIQYCTRAIQSGYLSRRDKAITYNSRGIAYGRKGDLDRAIADFDQAIGLKPDYADALRDRGYAYHLKGKYDQAIAGFTQSIRLKPKDALAFYNRGKAYREKGEYNRAIQDMGQAIRLNPDDDHALNGKAWLLATAPQDGLRNGAEAVGLANRAFSLSKNFGYLDTLAAAHAETGDFLKAIEVQQQAIKMLRDSGRAKYIPDYQSRLDLYRRRQPFRM